LVSPKEATIITELKGEVPGKRAQKGRVAQERVYKIKTNSGGWAGAHSMNT